MDVNNNAANSDAESVSTAADLHVVMLLNYIPIHFISCMRHLSQRLQRLSFLLSVPMEAGREWAPQFEDFEVRMQRTLSFNTTYHHPHGFDYPGKVYLPLSTVFDLADLRPDVVISLEVGPRTIQAFLLRFLGFRYKLIVQLRESETTALLRGRLRHLLRRWILPRVDQVMVNGRSGARYAESCGVSPNRITIVPSGTDLEYFGHSTNKEFDPNHLKLLYVGAVIPLKGIAKLIPILASAVANSKREVSLTILGKGEDEQIIKNQKLPDNLEISWLPFTDYRDLEAVYDKHDVLLMPSLCDEWGMVVNEAMACGLPVLGCLGSQAVDELISDDVNGWAYPAVDDQALRTALDNLLKADSEALAEMSVRAKKAAFACSDLYSAEQIQLAIERSIGTADSKKQ